MYKNSERRDVALSTGHNKYKINELVLPFSNGKTYFLDKQIENEVWVNLFSGTHEECVSEKRRRINFDNNNNKKGGIVVSNETVVEDGVVKSGKGNVGETRREIVKNVIAWGKEKGILDHSSSLDQFEKTMEEVLELHSALILRDEHETIDAIGDIQVTLILQCALLGIDFDQTLKTAYDVISKRTGKMVNGKFVKDK